MIHFSISVFLGQSLTARDLHTSFLQSSLSTLHKSQLTAGTGAFYNESQHNVTVTERLCCWEGYSTKKSTSQVLSASLSAPSRTGWVATGWVILKEKSPPDRPLLPSADTPSRQLCHRLSERIAQLTVWWPLFVWHHILPSPTIPTKCTPLSRPLLGEKKNL